MYKYAQIYINTVNEKLAWGEMFDRSRAKFQSNGVVDPSTGAHATESIVTRAGNGLSGLFGMGLGLTGKGIQGLQNIFGFGRRTGNQNEAAKQYAATGQYKVDRNPMWMKNRTVANSRGNVSTEIAEAVRSGGVVGGEGKGLFNNGYDASKPLPKGSNHVYESVKNIPKVFGA
jgi:hypothetical protein